MLYFSDDGTIHDLPLPIKPPPLWPEFVAPETGKAGVGLEREDSDNIAALDPPSSSDRSTELDVLLQRSVAPGAAGCEQ